MKIFPTPFIGSRLDRIFLGIGMMGLWACPFVFGWMALEASPLSMKIAFIFVGIMMLLLAYTLSVTLRGFKFVLTGKDS